MITIPLTITEHLVERPQIGNIGTMSLKGREDFLEIKIHKQQ